MIATILNNPFCVGDLVHIPQGTTLYKMPKRNKHNLHEMPIPIKVSSEPSVGLILNKSNYDFYLVSIGNNEYIIKSDEVNFINKAKQHVY